jgi:hypothetical protein
MCVLSVRELLRWTAAHGRPREPWLAMLRSGLTELGVSVPRVATLADLVLDTLDGLLDRLINRDTARAAPGGAASPRRGSRFSRLAPGPQSGLWRPMSFITYA